MIDREIKDLKILPPRMDFVFKLLFGDERNKDILESFLRAPLENADESDQGKEREAAAHEEDRRADGVHEDGQDEYCEEKERQEKEADLEVDAGVVPLEAFVCDEGRDENDEERPGDRDDRAAHIEDDESAKQPAEEELEDVYQPEVKLGRIGRGRNGVDALVLFAVDEHDADGDDDEMDEHPEVLPEMVDSGERDGVEEESADERDRGDRALEFAVPGADALDDYHVQALLRLFSLVHVLGSIAFLYCTDHLKRLMPSVAKKAI